ncbi:MAG: hypothetical protein V7735_23575 [Photobacterium frigidiphilum]|uniref:hypothetical protein n=1 Tax=Photobacterium frigidiphilum TaxID=264736 RepID=UPI003001AA2D
MLRRKIAILITMILFSSLTISVVAAEAPISDLFLNTLNEPVLLLPESTVFFKERVSIDDRSRDTDASNMRITDSFQNMSSIYTSNTLFFDKPLESNIKNNVYDGVECEGEECAVPVALMALDFMLTNNQ